jgi:hypothetical protein
MQITTTQNDVVVYSRLTEDPKAVTRAIGYLMSLPVSQDGLTTKIVNAGNDFTFRNSSLDVGLLVRHVEGIVVRTKTAA